MICVILVDDVFVSKIDKYGSIGFRGYIYLVILVLTYEKKEKKYPLKSRKQIFQSNITFELCRFVGGVFTH